MNYVRERARFLIVIACLLPACGGDDQPPVATHHGAKNPRKCSAEGSTLEPADELEPEVECDDAADRHVMCIGEWAAECAGGKQKKLTNCRIDEQVCVAGECDGDDCDGCRECRPGEIRCDADGGRARCKDDGSGYEPSEPCETEQGLFCNPLSSECEDLCRAAEESHTYIGCEYWAVATSNSQLLLDEQSDDGVCHPFAFAVVIANPQSVTATVRVESPGHGTQEVRVEPGDVATVDLPCALELKGVPLEDGFSVRTSEAAQHITSDVPVTVYQFNPLEFREQSEDGKDVYSFTNDASLLLPVHALGSDYVVLARPTLQHEYVDTVGDEPDMHVSGPGFVAITGVDDEPTKVEITSSAYLRPSEDGILPAAKPGDVIELSLNKGEVVQLLSATPDDCPWELFDTVRGAEIHYCDVPKEYDLTGTRIHMPDGGRVSVIAGHDCAFVPYNRWACDHVEESLFPVEAWGKDVLLGLSAVSACQDPVPNMARVVAATDGTRVNFAPEVHEPVTLDAGEFVEFEFDQDFRASASQAIMVGQFLLGQDYEGMGSAGSFAKGDPSMSLGIPLEQWRSDYVFLTPSTYTDNFANVIAREHQVVQLDGALVQGYTPIEGTPMRIARVPVAPGQHRLTSPGSVGLVLYGYGTYTSYMLPGGLDLNEINGLQ